MIARFRRQSPVFQLALAIALAVAAALGHVYLHLQVIQSGYAISRESKVRHDLEEQNQKLRLELAVRRDPSIVERRAREELHMAPPDPAAIRILHVGRTVPATATASPRAAPSSQPTAQARAPEGARPW